MASLYKGWTVPKKFIPQNPNLSIDCIESPTIKATAPMMAALPMQCVPITPNMGGSSTLLPANPNKQYIIRGWLMNMIYYATNPNASKFTMTAKRYPDNTYIYPFMHYQPATTAGTFNLNETGLFIMTYPNTAVTLSNSDAAAVVEMNALLLYNEIEVL